MTKTKELELIEYIFNASPRLVTDVKYIIMKCGAELVDLRRDDVLKWLDEGKTEIEISNLLLSGQ